MAVNNITNINLNKNTEIIQEAEVDGIEILVNMAKQDIERH